MDPIRSHGQSRAKQHGQGQEHLRPRELGSRRAIIFLSTLGALICVPATSRASGNSDPFPRYQWAADDECWAKALLYRSEILREAKERKQIPDAAIHERKMLKQYESCMLEKTEPKPGDTCRQRAREERAFAQKLEDPDKRQARLDRIQREEDECIAQAVVQTEDGCPVSGVNPKALELEATFARVDEARRPTAVTGRLLCHNENNDWKLQPLLVSVLRCIARDLETDPAHAPSEITLEIPLEFQIARDGSQSRALSGQNAVKSVFKPGPDEALSLCVNRVVGDDAESWPIAKGPNVKSKVILNVTTPPASAFVEKRAAKGELDSAGQVARECSRKVQALQDVKMQDPAVARRLHKTRLWPATCADVRRLDLSTVVQHISVSMPHPARSISLIERELAEEKLLLENRAESARKVLVAAGKSIGERDCQSRGHERAKQTTSERCAPPLVAKALVPFFNETQLKRIDVALVRAFIDSSAKRGMGVTTLHHCVRLLGRFLNELVIDGKLPANPVARLDRATRRLLRSTHDPRKTPFIRRKEEIAAIYGEFSTELRVMFALGVFAGLRTGGDPWPAH